MARASTDDAPEGGAATMDPEARGTAFIGIRRQVKVEFGEPQLAKVLESAPETVRAIVGHRIAPLRWYPYSAFVALLRHLDEFLGRGDLRLCRHLGSQVGKHDLETIFSTYTRQPSAERLIQSCGFVWDAYYRNAGRMSAVSSDRNDTRLQIVDFPGMDPAHCRLMEGWMIAAMRCVGARVHAGAGETQCMSEGAPLHEFRCRWSLESGHPAGLDSAEEGGAGQSESA